MPDRLRKRITQLPFATPHQNSALQCIPGLLTKFNQALIGHLDFFHAGNQLPGGVLATHRP